MRTRLDSKSGACAAGRTRHRWDERTHEHTVTPSYTELRHHCRFCSVVRVTRFTNRGNYVAGFNVPVNPQ